MSVNPDLLQKGQGICLDGLFIIWVMSEVMCLEAVLIIFIGDFITFCLPEELVVGGSSLFLLPGCLGVDVILSRISNSLSEKSSDESRPSNSGELSLNEPLMTWEDVPFGV